MLVDTCNVVISRVIACKEPQEVICVGGCENEINITIIHKMEYIIRESRWGHTEANGAGTLCIYNVKDWFFKAAPGKTPPFC